MQPRNIAWVFLVLLRFLEFKQNTAENVPFCYTFSGYTDIKIGFESQLQVAVATVGPISAAIHANLPSFHLYSKGVYDEPGCSSIFLNHGVLVVGYGTFNGKEYWLVKNSWGTSWGMNGYIMMSRNKDNQCGIATCAMYPLV